MDKQELTNLVAEILSQMHEPQRNPKGKNGGKLRISEAESKRQIPFSEVKADIGGKT